ncbi:hypothetical protein FNV43_RR15210 [Rhamnella rubrinervis]|uniref:Uncharacterized protein n=1 Tax=Rhamnella rubrinervis TaxID=2594499 RepID=A0A8K0GU08_9ROSA|nr:hypothetical protein FNV43_RR15210 [Rhamnella rubrinervis]
MGGGEHGHAEGAHGHGHGLPPGDFRQKVWTMTGGPNCRPRHWRRNTAIAMAGIVLLCIPIAMKSAELECLKMRIINPGICLRIGLFASPSVTLWEFIIACPHP